MICGASLRAWARACTRVSALLLPAVFLVSLTAQQPVAAAPGQPAPAIKSVTVEPAAVTLLPGESKQFSASVAGSGAFGTAVSWSVNGIDGGSPALGTIGVAGTYVTPYPAPASVTIRATSKMDPSKSAEATVTFAVPPTAEGPTLRVDAGSSTHAISPLIYGMNAWRLNDPDGESTKVAEAVRLPLDRWGGDSATRYNYKLDITNAGNDWFFENIPNRNREYPDVSRFNTQVERDRATGAKTMGTVPVMGWVAKSRMMAGSFSVTKYGKQQKTDPNWPVFGNGFRPDGTPIVNNDPSDTCMKVDATWAGDWVKYLVNRFGDAAHGGVAIYSLDNEPNWWNAVHRDVHPDPMTYDEVTGNGLKVAKAVKAADPAAEVTGPVIDFWLNYFYSSADLQSARKHAWNFATAALDRKAHGDVPLVEYYLRAFHAAQDADPNHTRFLDYLDLHTYFAAGNAMLKPAGNSRQQQIVLNSTRALWDPTYTDFPFRNPNNMVLTMAPQIIPRMKRWVADDYPGTRTAITEYNWGAPEHISGAVAEADILGIFGREGLDLGALWGPPDLNQPLLFAFKMYRNYDNAGGAFGDQSLAAASADQGKLSIYAARRTSDRKMTIVVINKTFGDLRSEVAIAHFKVKGRARAYRYSGADLAQIRKLHSVKCKRVPKSPDSMLTAQLFPAMSITLFAVKGQ